MTWKVDARVPVRFGTSAEAAADDAILLETPSRADPALGRFTPAPPKHARDCVCCAPHSPAAVALNALFQARARGEAPFFRRIVAVTQSTAGDLEVGAALRSDPLTSGRFRLE